VQPSSLVRWVPAWQADFFKKIWHGATCGQGDTSTSFASFS
jgi:hypothetical protein